MPPPLAGLQPLTCPPPRRSACRPPARARRSRSCPPPGTYPGQRGDAPGDTMRHRTPCHTMPCIVKPWHPPPHPPSTPWAHLGPVVAGPLRGVVGLDSTLGHGVTQGLAGGPRLPLLCHCLVQIYIWLPSFSVTEPFYCNFFNLLPLPWLFLHLIPIILLLLLFLTVTQTVFTLFTFFR